MSDEMRIGAPPAAATPPTPAKRRLWPWIAGAAAVLVLVVGVAVGVTIAVMSSREPTAPAPPATMPVLGQIELSLGGFTWSSTTQECWGYQGYDDIRKGVAVAVTDSAGKVVAMGELDKGKPLVNGDRASACLFKFEVKDVPAGLKFYGLEVSHRGVVKYTEEDLAASTGVTMTLGR